MKTEEKIFRAAMQLFIEKGKHGAKMQEIADKADINKAMLHYYFENKEQLYGYVFETVLKKVFGSLPSIFNEHASFSIALRLFIDQYTDMINANPQIPMFVMRELSQNEEAPTRILSEMWKAGKFDLPLAFLKSAEKAIEEHEIKQVDPMQLMLSVIGSINYFFMAEPMFKTLFEEQESFDRQEFVQHRKADIYNMVYNGIKCN